MFRMGLIGKKIGMTQIFEDGERIAVTVVQLGPNTVIQKKTTDSKDGYNAIQIGFDDKPHKKVSKPMKGHFERSGVKPKWILREVRIHDPAKIADFEVGQELTVDFLSAGDFVDICGISKGKGFQGVVRKHNMKGAKQKTHGTHEQFRHPGSIGCRSTPGEVNKGKRLPGQMGNARVTIQNVRVVKVEPDKHLVLLRGSVPGPRNGYVMIHEATKKLHKKKAAA